MLVQWVLQTCGTFTFNNDVLIADYLSIYLSFNNTNLGIIPRNHRGHTLNTHSVSFLYNFLYICVSVFLCPSPSFIVGTVQARKWFASECTEAMRQHTPHLTPQILLLWKHYLTIQHNSELQLH